MLTLPLGIRIICMLMLADVGQIWILPCPLNLSLEIKEEMKAHISGVGQLREHRCLLHSQQLFPTLPGLMPAELCLLLLSAAEE